MAEIAISYDENGHIASHEFAVQSASTTSVVAPVTKPVGKTKKEEQDIISFREFEKQIPDEEAAIAFFESRRWRNGAYCPLCGFQNVYRVKSGKPLSHRCRDCKEYFSARMGTPLEKSLLPTRVWLLAIHWMHTARKGVSAMEMHKRLGVSYPTAWFLNHRIREAMKVGDTTVSGIVEVDETYVGGKMKSMHKADKPANPMANKFAVVGFKDHNSNVIAFPVSCADIETLQNAVLDHVKPWDTVYTDGHPAYQILSQFGYTHEWVNHSTGQYVNGLATTNGIESFWALLKRGYIGTFHWMSWKHLHRYVNEFAYRHNSGPGNGWETMGATIERMIGERLTWKRLTAKEARA